MAVCPYNSFMAYDKNKIRVKDGFIEMFYPNSWNKIAGGDVRCMTPEMAEIEAEKRYLQWFKGIYDWQYSSKGINLPITLKYDVTLAGLSCGEIRHPEVVMKVLGINYKQSVPHSIADVWIFEDCLNVPETLPDYLSIAR